MAQLNKVSKQTLRLYDKLGLLIPIFTDETNGYRYYDVKQSAKLDMIQHMKSMGMSLKDIKIQLSENRLPFIKDILEKKKESIDYEIKDLIYKKRAIERTIESFEYYENSPPDGTILLEFIERRAIYVVDSKINFYDYEIEVYEKILRELKESLTINNLPSIYFFNAGSILRKENLLEKRFISTEVFVFVDEEYVNKDLITIIPRNPYLCIYCDRFEKEKEYANRLLDEINKRGYTINGHYICEVLAEMPIFSDNSRSMFLRLQIPIKFR